MAARVSEILMGNLDRLRYEPVDKRIRGVIGDRTVVDTRLAVLLWEPKRVVPSYAVPAEDLDVVLRPAAATPDANGQVPRLGDRPVHDPSVPFAVHTADGEAFDLLAGDTKRPGAAFSLGEELSGYVALDFTAFDAWYEEDERNFGHPRDPFHRIEIVHSSRSVRVESNGAVLAESVRPYLLFESMLPVRYYLPDVDVDHERLRPSPTRSTCAYKGHASYLSAVGTSDVAWTYPEPLREAVEIKDRVAFFNERVDFVIDGARVERPVTPWSAPEAH
jgi:uncharacterized protein (DUF427 family)